MRRERVQLGESNCNSVQLTAIGCTGVKFGAHDASGFRELHRIPLPILPSEAGCVM